MMLCRAICLAACLAIPIASVSAQVTQATGELEIKMLVTSACEVSGSGSGGIGTAVLDFGTTALLLHAIDADTGTSGTQALEVLCNPNVTYTVHFDAGQNATQTTDRAMRRDGGSELVRYQLYTEASRNTTLTSVAGIGTGTAQSIQVYGRVPPQPAPVPGNYRDVVTVTVTF
jgi:spore coat protein U-like protein